MKKTALVFVLMAILVITGLAENNEKDSNDDKTQKEENYRTGPDVFELDRFLIDHLPGGNFYTSFIENYAPDATYMMEESNGFALIDNPRIYFEGDSFINFNWYYNGININSALNDGTPGVLLPFSSIRSYRLSGEAPQNRFYGMNFVSETPRGNYSRAEVSGVLSNMGGYWATWMLQPDHPKERADKLYTTRRKIDGNFYLDYRLARKFQRSTLALSLNYFDIKRQFNDFNALKRNHDPGEPLESTYIEDGKLFLADARYRRIMKTGYMELFGVFNILDRSNLLSELGSYPQETLDKSRSSILAGLVMKKSKLRMTLSVMLENEDLKPFQKNYTGDLIENDGDGIYPYGKGGETKMGKFTGTTFNLDLNYSLKQPKSGGLLGVDAYVTTRYSILKGEETVHDYNSILFDGQPYQVVLWNSGSDYTNTNMNATGGINLTADISESMSVLAKLFVNVDRLAFDQDRNNLSFVTPGFDIGLLLFRNKCTNLLLSYGHLPYDTRENVNFFLEPERPGGTIYRWNDADGDGQYMQGEEGSVYGYTGGQYRYVDDDIKAPVKQRLLLHFYTPLSKNWSLSIKGIYKKIKNNFRVKFTEEYGFYEAQNGNEIYFFDRPFEDYYLTNGGYEKDPFYAHFHFKIDGRKENKWFFSFSFMAHMGMGNTAFGNGPASNDFGILDESQANPNSWLNGFGRVDGERGFVAKSYVGLYLARNLFVTINLKYRDGNPFAFFNSVERYGQQVIYYQTIKGEDEKGKKGGPREDYIGDLSMKFTYKFKLFNNDALISLAVFNILDVGGELSEYIYSGGTRDSVELQIPRSIRLTFNWRF
jgi:hypothetical protein